VPLGSEMGWKAAVFDHFRAVSTAIATKLRRGQLTKHDANTAGGTTLSFSVHDAHPKQQQVLDLLREVRSHLNSLCLEVSRYNLAHPVSADQARTVTFYFGQSAEDTTWDGPPGPEQLHCTAPCENSTDCPSWEATGICAGEVKLTCVNNSCQRRSCQRSAENAP
jgi:hypothetical protein